MPSWGPNRGSFCRMWGSPKGNAGSRTPHRPKQKITTQPKALLKLLSLSCPFKGSAPHTRLRVLSLSSFLSFLQTSLDLIKRLRLNRNWKLPKVPSPKLSWQCLRVSAGSPSPITITTDTQIHINVETALRLHGTWMRYQAHRFTVQLNPSCE